MDYKTVNDSHLEALEVFLHENDVEFENVVYDPYMQQYVEIVAKDEDVIENDKDRREFVQRLRYFPKEINESMSLVHQKFEHVRFDIATEYVDYDVTNLEM